jgi:serine/threonine protein kinase
VVSSDPLLTQVIGNYQIEERLGRGGMATVYRARQLNMHRDVAIKIMSAELASDPQFVARFEREAKVIASLEHPRIVPVHDFGHEGDLFYLVMRLIEGETLYDRMLAGPLPPQTAAKLIAQIAEALDYAHERGVVHRDLKPNNILLDDYDNVYMMDFGLAKLVAATSNLTETGMVLGTPAYMAPEQWRGDPVDARTDVYALGVILYEMICGQPPFEGADTPFTLMYKHLNDTPQPPREILSSLPASVDAVILRALAKDPDDRYPSAGALARDFAAALEGAPIEAPILSHEPVPPPTTIAPPVPAAMPVPPGTPGLSGVGMPETYGAPMPGVRKPKPKPKRGKPAHDTPQSVDEAVAWASERVSSLVIPGFIAPPPEEMEPAPLLTVDTGEQPPTSAIAYEQLSPLLNADETLAGVLYLRGTDNWRSYRRLILIALGLSILGGIFGGIFDLWIINLVGTIAWFYLIIQAIQIARGVTGHYYIGFTPQRLIVQPLSQRLRSYRDEAQFAPWFAVRRLVMTDEYFWLEADAGTKVEVLGWLPAQAPGGLGRQRKWLLASAIARLLHEKGFPIRRT